MHHASPGYLDRIAHQTTALWIDPGPVPKPHCVAVHASARKRVASLRVPWAPLCRSALKTLLRVRCIPMQFNAVVGQTARIKATAAVAYESHNRR